MLDFSNGSNENSVSFGFKLFTDETLQDYARIWGPDTETNSKQKLKLLSLCIGYEIWKKKKKPMENNTKKIIRIAYTKK